MHRLVQPQQRTLKAKSHVACRTHAVLLRIQNVSFPFDLHSAAVSDSHLTMPFFSGQRHNTAIKRQPVGYLPAFGFFQLPRGVPRRLLSEAYQFSSQRSIPTTVKSGSSTLQKRRSVKLVDQQFGYFRLPCGLSRRTRHCRSVAGVRHGMCELTARHAMCESALIPTEQEARWTPKSVSIFWRRGKSLAPTWIQSPGLHICTLLLLDYKNLQKSTCKMAFQSFFFIWQPT